VNPRKTNKQHKRIELDLEVIADLEADHELESLRGGGKLTLTTQNTDKCISLSGGT